MKKRVTLLIITAGLLLLASCTTSPVCVTSSVTPLQGKTITDNLGRVKGYNTAYSILGLYMIGRPDTELAIKDALSQKGGDTLINVTCYETFTWFILFSANTVKVEGDAVKITSDVFDKKGKKR